MKILQTLFTLFFTMAAVAADKLKPYDEAADAKVQIKEALTEVASNQIPIIIVFGANWCPDCMMLESAMKTGSSAPLLARDFKVVKIDVGRFDKNLDVGKMYGVPISNGIPAIAIVSSKNEVLYATKAGELSKARKMGEDGIYEFFKKVTKETAGKK